MTSDPFAALRQRMVDEQIIRRGIRDTRVIAALLKVPRHKFVPADLTVRAYDDGPLPIGHGQTISQPYIVAYMSEKLTLTGNEKVLELGTGCGYQTAILAENAAQVFSIEIIPELGHSARRLLSQEFHYTNIHFRIGRGQAGWPEDQPFDRIILTAAPEHAPSQLFLQLADEGILLAPEGTFPQRLIHYTKHGTAIEREELIGVSFVPLVDSR